MENDSHIEDKISVELSYQRLMTSPSVVPLLNGNWQLRRRGVLVSNKYLPRRLFSIEKIQISYTRPRTSNLSAVA